MPPNSHPQAVALMLLSLFLLLSIDAQGDGDAVPSNSSVKLIWNMHAASLYQLDTTPQGPEPTHVSPLLPQKSQFVTSKCVLNDLDDLSDSAAAEVREQVHSGAATRPFEASEQMIPLYGPLWGSEAGHRSASRGSSGRDGLRSRVFVAGRLSFGPFQAEKVQNTPAVPSGAGRDDDDETDKPFQLSIFLGESTEKLCYDVSLYRSLEDVGYLSTAIMTWTSSSYASSCRLRLTGYMAMVLNLTASKYYYRSRDPSIAPDPTADLSPWRGACELPIVDRYDFTFVPSDVLARDSFCRYAAKDSSTPPAAGSRRQVECSVVLAVQFRPWTGVLTEEERRQALLKIAAGLTLAPPRPLRAEVLGGGRDPSSPPTPKGADSGVVAHSGSSAGSTAPDLDKDSGSSPYEEGGAVARRASAASDASASSRRVAREAEISQEGSASETVSHQMWLTGLFQSEDHQVRRCDDLSIAPHFWNITGPFCQRVGELIPDSALNSRVIEWEDWWEIGWLVLSSVAGAALTFCLTRAAIIFWIRRGRYSIR